MKKESAFKMKGFSGFGNSPVKKNSILDTKLKDVPKTLKKSVKKVSKKASDAISNVKEKIGNTTARDVLKNTLEYKLYKKLKKTLNKKTKNNGSDAGKKVSDAIKSLEERGLGHKRLVTVKRTPNKPVKTIKKLPVKKIPVNNTVRLTTTPKKYNVPKKKKA